jgi:hypothetical protein
LTSSLFFKKKGRYKKMKKNKKVTGRFLAVLCSICTAALMLTFPASPVFADAISDAAKKGSEGFVETLQAALPYILTAVVAIVGVVLIIGGQRTKEDVKAEAPHKIIGVVLVMMAGGVAAAFIAWTQ